MSEELARYYAWLLLVNLPDQLAENPSHEGYQIRIDAANGYSGRYSIKMIAEALSSLGNANTFQLANIVSPREPEIKKAFRRALIKSFFPDMEWPKVRKEANKSLKTYLPHFYNYDFITYTIQESFKHDTFEDCVHLLDALIGKNDIYHFEILMTATANLELGPLRSNDLSYFLFDKAITLYQKTEEAGEISAEETILITTLISTANNLFPQFTFYDNSELLETKALIYPISSTVDTNGYIEQDSPITANDCEQEKIALTSFWTRGFEEYPNTDLPEADDVTLAESIAQWDFPEEYDPLTKQRYRNLVHKLSALCAKTPLFQHSTKIWTETTETMLRKQCKKAVVINGGLHDTARPR